MLAALTYTIGVASVVLLVIGLWDTAAEKAVAREKQRRIDDLRERRALRDAAAPQRWTYKDAA